MTPVVLASASPRRHELLTRIGVRFDVRAPDIDESPHRDEAPTDYVRRLASAKASVVDASPNELVIAADTTVDLDSHILGKPVDDRDAAAMLRRLSARTHAVHTGVAVRHGGRELVEVCTTSVTFAVLDEATIRWYISTGEPLDKAGSYALQGAGALLVERVDGSVSNVVGLPMHVLVELARTLGVNLLDQTS